MAKIKVLQEQGLQALTGKIKPLIQTVQSLTDTVDQGFAEVEEKYVPKTTTVNAKPLSGNISLGAGDVGAVPASRKVNGHALTEDITITAADTGALPTSGGTISGALTVTGAITASGGLAGKVTGDITGNAATATNATEHIALKNNPHAVTAAQAGAVPLAAAVSVSIPNTGWAALEGATSFKQYLDVTDSGVVATDIVIVSIHPDSCAAATACGMCPTCESLAGKIRVRANSVPGAALKAEYLVIKGKA